MPDVVRESARAALFMGADHPLEVRTLPLRRPDAKEVLVEVTLCTLCGSDVHSFEGRRAVATPTILGHEILGRIVEFGSNVPHVDASGQPLRSGDRVTWAIVASCGECFYCHRDLPQKCLRSVKYGHQQLGDNSVWNGGLADYCLLAANTSIFRVPDELTDAVACPANCATATVAAAIEAAGALTDRTVLVMGAGMLGLTACAMARDRGATHVICCDRNAERLAQALIFGATRTATPDNVTNACTELTAGFGVDAVLELTGATPAIQTALASLRMGGVLVEVGAVFPTPALELLPEQLVRRQWTLRGIHNYAPRHLQQALAFLAAQSHLPFGSLVAQWFSLAAADQAFRAAGSGNCFRVGVRP